MEIHLIVVYSRRVGVVDGIMPLRKSSFASPLTSTRPSSLVHGDRHEASRLRSMSSWSVSKTRVLNVYRLDRRAVEESSVLNEHDCNKLLLWIVAE